MSSEQPTKIQQLRSLVANPAAQAAFAATLLQIKLGQEVIFAALQILEKIPFAQVRPALLDLYTYYTRHGDARDPSAFTRGAIVRALRQIVLPIDLPLLVLATATYVFPPPSFKEEGAPLRSAALLALNEIDEPLARYHAVRLLANEHTDPMSGEPALTAARLLGTHEEVLPLYFYVMHAGAGVYPEVTAECLRHLTLLPVTLLPGLVERFAHNTSSMVLVGLFDLLLNHRAGPQELDFLRDFLVNTLQFDLYRYLATTMVASNQEKLLNELLAVARFEQRREKIAILCEALHLLPPSPEITTLLAQLNRRLGTTKQTLRTA
ncbi:hypothetical protein BH10CHL1_BH10CHL1_09640 [soil metagenome]